MEKEIKCPLTAQEKFEFIQDFEEMSSAIAVVGLLGVGMVPRHVLEKTVSLSIKSMLTCRVLIMHYTETDAETMALINTENEKRKAEDAAKKEAETKGA